MRLLLGAALCAALTLPTVASYASPATDLARAHVAAIAAGDTATLNASYRPDAFLWWVGGPLDGTYSGSSIAMTWTKFSNAQRGKLSAMPTISNVTESANAKGMTVALDVAYTPMLTVHQVMLVRDGKIQDEIWQIVAP